MLCSDDIYVVFVHCWAVAATACRRNWDGLLTPFTVPASVTGEWARGMWKRLPRDIWVKTANKTNHKQISRTPQRLPNTPSQMTKSKSLQCIRKCSSSHKYSSNTSQTCAHTANCYTHARLIICKQTHVSSTQRFRSTTNKICAGFLMWCDMTSYGQIVTDKRTEWAPRQHALASIVFRISAAEHNAIPIVRAERYHKSHLIK